MGYEEYKRKALEPIVSYIESVMASYSKEELEARIKEALPKKESEDERIKRFILTSLNYLIGVENSPGSDYDKQLKEAYSWLEKQKEQKPADIAPNQFDGITYGMSGFSTEHSAEWSEKHIADVFEKVGLAKIVREQGNDELTNALQDAMIELSKSGNAEWSEEDEQYLLVCKNALNKYQRSDHWDANIISKWLEEKLKSIRPQAHWKPSEEQIEALWKLMHSAVHLSNWGEFEKPIEAIYSGLKKL